MNPCQRSLSYKKTDHFTPCDSYIQLSPSTLSVTFGHLQGRSIQQGTYKRQQIRYQFAES